MMTNELITGPYARTINPFEPVKKMPLKTKKPVTKS
jgi:hypothetical protein